MYWSVALSKQTKDAELQAEFAPIAKKMRENEIQIVAELNTIQGKPVNIGGYYKPSDELADKAMRPSDSLNNILN